MRVVDFGRFGRGAIGASEPTTWSTASSEAGSVTSNVWTPGRDANGYITQASVDALPANTWVSVSGTQLNAITDAITAETGFAFSRYDVTGDGIVATFDAWVGMATDYQRYMWNYCGGGHADSAVNGLWALDLLKMAWEVEQVPSDPYAPGAEWSDYYRDTDGTKTSYSTGASDPNTDPEDGLLWDKLPDGRSTSKHNYNGIVYDSGRDQIIMTRISKWTHDRQTGSNTRQRWTRDGTTPVEFNTLANIFYHAGNDALYGYFDSQQGFRFGKVALPGSQETSITSTGFAGTAPQSVRLDDDRALFFWYTGGASKIENAAIFNMAEEQWYRFNGSSWVPRGSDSIAVAVTDGVQYTTTFAADSAGQMALHIPTWGAAGQVIRSHHNTGSSGWWLYDIATHSNTSYTPNGAASALSIKLPFNKWVSIAPLGIAVGIDNQDRTTPRTNPAVLVMRYE